MTGESIYIKEHKQIIEGVIWRGTATGGAVNELEDTDIPAAYGLNSFKDERLFIYYGTGAGQTRKISAYDNATQTFTLYDNWTTNPDTDSRYQVIAGTGISGGAAVGAGTPYSGSITLGAIGEVDLITEVTQTTVAEIDAIYVDFTGWIADVPGGTTLTIRVYLDDVGGTLREVGNLRDVITQGTSAGSMVKIGGLGTFERNYKVTVQSSAAPGGAADNVKYHYVKYDRE